MEFNRLIPINPHSSFFSFSLLCVSFFKGFHAVMSENREAEIMKKSFWALHEGGRRWGHTKTQTGTLTHVHTLGMFWQRTEESSLTIATLLANCLHRENTLSAAHWLQPSLTVNRWSSLHCLIVLCTDLLWTCTQLCCVYRTAGWFWMGNRRQQKKNHSTEWWKRQGGGEGGSLPCVPPLPFLPSSKTFFLMNCLGEKGGSLFMLNRVWCKEGILAAFSTSYSHLFLSFLSIFPLVFVSVIGLTDHSSLTSSPGGKFRFLGINNVERGNISKL